MNLNMNLRLNGGCVIDTAYVNGEQALVILEYLQHLQNAQPDNTSPFTVTIRRRGTTVELIFHDPTKASVSTQTKVTITPNCSYTLDVLDYPKSW